MASLRPRSADDGVLAVSESDHGCVARLTTPRLILQNSELFLAGMSQLAGRKPSANIILDMSMVELIDSTAAMALAQAFKLVIRGGGSLELAAVRPHVCRMLTVAKLDGIIGIREAVPAGAYIDG